MTDEDLRELERMTTSPWTVTDRADTATRLIADRHYSRQKPGATQFVPPGRCLVLLRPQAYWVTSWPFAEFVKHAWPGAWICSAFRDERGPVGYLDRRSTGDDPLASDLILAAVAATRAVWDPPALGMVTFVDASKTKRKRDPGRCFRRAGFRPCGSTVGGLVALQLLPADMPPAQAAERRQSEMFA